MKKKLTGCCLAFALLLFFTDVCLAHRVNVFAFVDGDALRVECSFSRSQKVRHGKLTFSDLETGATLLESTTDEQGAFLFRPDANFLKTGHGVRILLNAGEGHQNQWQVAAEELAALSPAGPASHDEKTLANQTQTIPAQTALTLTAPAQMAPAQAPAIAAPFPSAAAAALDHEALEALIGKVMDAKLAPINQALARQQNDGPDIQDIIGGIGWILGLLGLATYLRYRPRRP